MTRGGGSQVSTAIKTIPIYGSTNPAPEQRNAAAIKRFASVIGLRPDKEQYYRELHANAWPAGLDRLTKSNITNCSIYIAELDGRKYLFSYFEYTGDNFETDMKAIADDPETQRWWKQTDPCQLPLDDGRTIGKWTSLEMVF